MRLIFRTIVCLLAMATAARSYPERMSVRVYGQQDGLGNLDINAIAQDQQGYLWIATGNGIFRYSGSSFSSFGRAEGLLDPAVYSMVIDGSGTVWAGTHSGLYWLKEGQFHEIFYKDHSLRVGMNSVLAAGPGGEIVVEGAMGLLSILPVSTTPAKPNRSPWIIETYAENHPGFPAIEDRNGVGFDRDGGFLLGCEDAICTYSVKNQFRRLGPGEGVPPDYYMSFFTSRNGAVWARGRKHVVVLDRGARMVRDLTPSFPKDGMNTIFRRFTEDSAGNMLTPTAQGFASWDGKAWTETVSTAQGDLQGTSEVFAGREGEIWIGTDGAGLLKILGYRQWTNYNTADKLSSPIVYSMAEDHDGALWLATAQSTHILAHGSFLQPSSLPATAEYRSTVVLVPAPDRGMWAVGQVGAVSHVSSLGKVDIHSSFDGYPNSAVISPQGALYIAATNGLYRAQCKAAESCKVESYHPERFKGHQIFALLAETIGDEEWAHPASNASSSDDKSGLWALTVEGLSHIDAEATGNPSSSRASQAFVSHISIPLPKQDFRLMAYGPKNTLWLYSLSSGLVRIRVQGKIGQIIEILDRTELASDAISFLRQDHAGRLWIGTDRGVQVLAEGKISLLNEEDGLIWNDTRTLLPAADGSVWIGTSHGMSHLLHPGAALGRENFAAVVEPIDYSQHILHSGDQLKWDGGTTVIRYGGLTFRGNESLRYHYRLEGFDQESIATKTPFVRFQKLPPGRYSFHVVAEDTRRHIFSDPATFTFVLIPPWWRTTWFNALLDLSILIAAASLFRALWRVRHKALLRQQQKLERLVEERTRELEQMATHDGLTRLLNRNAILATLSTSVEAASKRGDAVYVALIDLDHFKQINDTLGHLAGDEVLREAALRLTASIRASDAVGRYGGEEFLIVFRNADDKIGLERCERVRRAICDQPMQWSGKQLRITCSIGLSSTMHEGAHVPDLIASADAAMYRAKTGGRNRIECVGLEGTAQAIVSSTPKPLPAIVALHGQ